MSQSPPKWTLDQLTQGAEKALKVFRDARAAELREDYSSHFDDAQGIVEEVLELTNDLNDLTNKTREVVQNKQYLEVLRYLAAPPISADDLESLSGIKKSLWPKGQAETSDTLVEVVLGVIDAHRFPWVVLEVEPTEYDKRAAVVSTAAQIAASHVQTSRRIESKKAQENLVKQRLREAGFDEVDPRVINSLGKAPKAGQFCGESMLGGEKADVIIGLHNDKYMPVECKVSNSKVNSYKRINHEAANKAKDWINKFGTEQMLPAAVIAGVFNPDNLAKAQKDGLTIWWSQDLDDMIEWIATTAL